MSVYRSLAEIGPLPIWTGTLARAVEGRDLSLAVVELDAGAIVGLHHHPNEQLGLILKGILTFTIGGETRELRPGDTYVIYSNVPHSAVAGPEGCVALDVFAPVRADWHKLPAEPPRTPVWP